MRPGTRHAQLFRHVAGIYQFLTDHPYWEQHAVRLLERGGPLPPGARLLDLGCGPGGTTCALAALVGPGGCLIGLDRAASMVRRAARRAREQRLASPCPGFVLGDAVCLPFAPGSFDRVTGHSVLYLVPDQLALLREAHRVLAPGGLLLLLEPSAHGSLWQAGLRALPRSGTELRSSPGAALRFALSMATWRAYTLQRRFTRQELERLLTAAGFVDLSLEDTLGGLGLICRARRP